ncbi:hypothetical protein I4U23_007447 [Adineta vaga]|nr:hypothetical protein I4U23_007447 [Adineta vaga]
MKHNDVYLCREKLNVTSLRIWLHLRLNQSEQYQFSYYTFTLRTINLLDNHNLQLKDHFEKQIGKYLQINRTQNENHTINIHNLSPGRYEICVNLLYDKTYAFFYRSPNSCLYIPWDAPEYDLEEPNSVLLISFMIGIIMLVVSTAFCIHTIHQYVKLISSVPIVETVDENEEQDEDQRTSERAKFLVKQHFEPNINPFELLVRRRIHERYNHHSPDLNEK